MLPSDEETAEWKKSCSLYWLECHLNKSENLLDRLISNEHLTDDEQMNMADARLDSIGVRDRIVVLRKAADNEYWRLKNERESKA